jgi:hypothetical protein
LLSVLLCQLVARKSLGAVVRNWRECCSRNRTRDHYGDKPRQSFDITVALYSHGLSLAVTNWLFLSMTVLCILNSIHTLYGL